MGLRLKLLAGCLCVGWSQHMTFRARRRTKMATSQSYKCNTALSLRHFASRTKLRRLEWVTPRVALRRNNFFVPRQDINFMSQQAMTGSLCWAKQCLIGFRSTATPPGACFHLLFQQHLEHNGGDYIPPAVSRRFRPRRPLGIHRWQSRSVLPRSAAAAEVFCYGTAETRRFNGSRDKTQQINCCINAVENLNL